MSAYRRAAVSVCGIFAGVLEETEGGYRFTYDGAYLRREHPLHVSLTLPLRAEPYDSATLFSFFDGLIPEGWLLNAVSRNWKVDSRDRFGLLLIACKDCVGNVSIGEVAV